MGGTGQCPGRHGSQKLSKTGFVDGHVNFSLHDISTNRANSIRARDSRLRTAVVSTAEEVTFLMSEIDKILEWWAENNEDVFTANTSTTEPSS